MIEALVQTSAVGEGGKFIQPPAQSDVLQFNSLIQNDSAAGSIKGLVESAQLKVSETESKLNGKLKNFNLQDSVKSLVEATHISSMNSVSIQLTGKISAKVSEGFEQLIKQQ